MAIIYYIFRIQKIRRSANITFLILLWIMVRVWLYSGQKKAIRYPIACKYEIKIFKIIKIDVM